jgi:hypothetical protein
MEPGELVRFVRHHRDDAENQTQIAHQIPNVTEPGNDIGVQPKR